MIILAYDLYKTTVQVIICFIAVVTAWIMTCRFHNHFSNLCIHTCIIDRNQSIYSGAVTIKNVGTVVIVAEKQGSSGQADAITELTFTVTALEISCALMIGVTLPFPFCAAVTP